MVGYHKSSHFLVGDIDISIDYCELTSTSTIVIHPATTIVSNSGITLTSTGYVTFLVIMIFSAHIFLFQ